nr:hypothetical protein [Tanacetum cinerariifolium]
MLRACPHHRFTELTQIDTFYNGLNENDQDFLNAAAGGNLLSKTTREASNIIENKSKVHYSLYKLNVSRMNTNSRENASKTDDRIDKIADQISSLVDIFAKKVVTPATVKAVEESCVTCGGNHAYYNCDATNSNQSSVCAATDALLLMPKFSSIIKSLLANKDKLFKLAKIPLNENCSPMLLKKLPEKLGDPDQSITLPKGVAKDVFVKVGKFYFPTYFVVVDFEADPRVPLILGRSFLRIDRTLIDVYGEEITLRVNDKAVTFNLNQTTRYSSTYDDMSVAIPPRLLSLLFPTLLLPSLRTIKDLLRQCPYHGFSELHQLDTFYNALNLNDQDALDSAAGGNFLDMIPRECLSINESKSKVRYSRSRTTNSRTNTNAPLSSSLPSNSFDLQQIAASLEDKLDIRMTRFEKSLNDMKNSFVTPTAPIKAVEETKDTELPSTEDIQPPLVQVQEDK